MQQKDVHVSFVGFVDGRSLLTLDCDGAPMWLACELAPLCGHRLSSEVEDFLVEKRKGIALEGMHYVWVWGRPLDALKRRIRRQPGEIHPCLVTARRVLLVSEPGVMELSHEVGAKLRGYVRNKAVPEHEARTRARAKAGARGDHGVLQEAALELERRRVQAERLDRLVEELRESGEVDPQVVLTYQVAAAEVALGTKLHDIKPRLGHGWMAPAEIAERYLGLTLQALGKVITGLGLRSNAALSKAVLNKARGHDKTVVSYIYSPQAIVEIDQALVREGFRRVEGAA